MAIVGLIALTLALGYAFLVVLAFAIPPLIGFDEYHIPAGLLLLAVDAGIAVLWWFTVGHLIHISVSV